MLNDHKLDHAFSRKLKINATKINNKIEIYYRH
jgi:hypothetical protein